MDHHKLGEEVRCRGESSIDDDVGYLSYDIQVIHRAKEERTSKSRAVGRVP